MTGTSEVKRSVPGTSMLDAVGEFPYSLDGMQCHVDLEGPDVTSWRRG